MARPTVLTDLQKSQILTMAAQGATSYAIGKSMGLPATTVSRHMAAAEKCSKAAKAIVRIEKEISTYSIPEQSATMDLLASLRAISTNLARAAVIGTENAARIHSVAKIRLDQATIDPDRPDFDAMKDVGALSRIANEAAAMGIQLINANKDKSVEPPAAVPRLEDFYRQ